ncbi:MAG: histone deacetylase family protein [Anaerolineae bacterium]|jgi:acetoin utilization deacetylase AcuC-like enzyme|nr:histone deacetylase family protein [Anaerolineae bacterium]
MYTIYSERHLRHTTDDVWVEDERYLSAEVPERARAIVAAVSGAALGPIIPPNDHGLSPVLAVHTPDYVDYLTTAFERYAIYAGAPRPVLADREGVDPKRLPRRPQSFPSLRDYYTYDYEDPILEGTWEAAYWSVQVALTAAELARAGERIGYALCRPPGHHATPDQYGGFCYLNNAAAAARFLSPEGRVAILDLDYHHGNGTQAIFYADPTTLYVSLHADPASDYPHYWGFAGETGTGAGLGLNLNLPLPLHCSDARYLAALERGLEATARFAPKYLVLSLGADAVIGDDIGKFDLSLEGWSEAACRTASLGVPTVIVQEGGYNLRTLGTTVVTFLESYLSCIPRNSIGQDMEPGTSGASASSVV